MPTEEIAGLDNIAKLFSIFHDGVIVDASPQGEDLRLTVRLSYLAERVQPGFTTFTLLLRQLEELSFSTWPKESSVPPETLRDVHTFFSPPLDILSAEPSNCHVQVESTVYADPPLWRNAFLSPQVRPHRRRE
jgi:hypothetical protein